MTLPSPIHSLLSRCLRATSTALGRVISGLTRLRTNGVNYIRVRHLDFVPRGNDLYVCTYPRSGTTWMQMILYQLTTTGTLDFTHISEVSPWFERACTRGDDMERFPSPRIIKTHLLPHRLPADGHRCIYVRRDGLDVATSYYHFYTTHMGYRGPFSAFFEHFLRGTLYFGSWFEYTAAWDTKRDDPLVLSLRYEELIEDLEGSVRRIAAFCELSPSEETFRRVVSCSSFDFMKQHETKFDHRTERQLEDGLRPDGAFLRTGRPGGWASQLTPVQFARFQLRLQETGLAPAGVGSPESP